MHMDPKDRMNLAHCCPGAVRFWNASKERRRRPSGPKSEDFLDTSTTLDLVALSTTFFIIS